MRAMFALVLTAGVAAGAALVMWDDGGGAEGVRPIEGGAAAAAAAARGDAEFVNANVAPDSQPVRVGRGSAADAAAVPARADAIAAQLRGHLREQRVDLAARTILRAEAGVLAAEDVRALALQTADSLVREAAAASGTRPTGLRLDARRIYAAVYDCDAASKAQTDRAFEACRALHRVLVTGAAAPDETVLRHKFEPGDSLWKLARGPWKKAGVTAETGFILYVNGLSDARRIQAGQTLRIPREPVSLLIRKSRYELTLRLGGAPFARFPIGLGADDSTPEGVFIIATKIENPDWYFGGRKIPFGDPENVIGTRWLGFSGDATAEGIGIHGTVDEATVGRSVSLGCIRMRRSDVETLFEWVGRGAQVDVRR